MVSNTPYFVASLLGYIRNTYTDY